MKGVDIFAGGGGFTTGAEAAGVEIVWAANHSPLAVNCHAANYPGAVHVCQDLHLADFTLLPRHDVLLAAPCCHGHTPARGRDRPQHDKSRATAWAVVSCVEVNRPAVVVVENVPHFLQWKLYPAWLQAMKSLGYAYAPLVIDAADHGVPQHRVRYFGLFTRSRKPLQLDLERQAHVAVSGAIQWDRHHWSKIERPGRAAATLERVAAGRAKFGDRFIMPYYGSGSGRTGRSILRPLGTITTRDRWGLVDGNRMRMLQLDELKPIMGFPSGYSLPGTRRQGIHLLGDAVCPPVARDLLLAIKQQG